ncbi:PAS domain S-box protein [Paucibacter sp. Y2R2-4]|uniref:PAS domain S-box protein n=1 Tax=Paucibacter sp. Y2R2-4 TaxID=2893553 RepID=UPI0029625AFA|nr:PAS domain S-box protein [Paucibacter sp. Y2R2-4]
MRRCLWITTSSCKHRWIHRKASRLPSGGEESSISRNAQLMHEGTVSTHFQDLFMKVPLPLCWVASDGAILQINLRFEAVFGYTQQDMPTLDHWWPLAYPDPDYRQWVCSTWEAAVALAAAEKRDIAPIEYKVRCKNGRTVTMEISGTTLGDGFLATFIDVTERNAAQEHAQQLAFYDPLTQLPNRRLLMTRLEHLLLKLQRSQHFAALMVVDLVTSSRSMTATVTRPEIRCWSRPPDAW